MLAGLGKFTEEKVDNMRRQKDEELEAYIKQTQRAKRFEAKSNQVLGTGGAEPKVGKMQAAADGQRDKRFKPMPQQTTTGTSGQMP